MSTMKKKKRIVGFWVVFWVFLIRTSNEQKLCVLVHIPATDSSHATQRKIFEYHCCRHFVEGLLSRMKKYIMHY